MGLIFSLSIFENHLRDILLFKFILLRHIHIGYNNIYLRERLSFNTFIRTFVHSTIVALTWYSFTSYDIVLPTSISALVFQPGSICFRYIILSHKLNCT